MNEHQLFGLVLQNLPSIGEAIFGFLEIANDYDDRQEKKYASKKAVSSLYAMYRNGDITKSQFLKMLDVMLPNDCSGLPDTLEVRLERLLNGK